MHKKPIVKEDIVVVPTEIADSSKFMNVISEEDDDNHIYEELPLGPEGANYPDVKISVI